jgi:2'-phosphotransferase
MIPISEAPTDSSDAAVVAEASTPITFEADNDDPSNFLIRANQGHSIKVEEEGLLEAITLESELPATVVHGTTHRAWPQILSSGGLKKMTRNHVHFASGLPAGFEPLEGANDIQSEAQKEPVISGMRNTSSVLVFIDVKKALEGGLKFWKSANGVILSEGNGNGVVPLAYFARVEERKRGVGILMKDGEVVNELPEALTRGGDGGRRGGRGGGGRR